MSIGDPRQSRKTALVMASGLLLVIAFTDIASAEDAPNDAAGIKFFETKIRPLLASRCYECHSRKSKKLKAKLSLDSRAAMLKGGDSGPAIVPGNPDKSALIEAVRWQTFEMPPSGKLKPDEVAALSKWVEMGAPWPKEAVGVAQETEQGYDWDKARKHWAFLPVTKPELPTVSSSDWCRNPIDRFVLARLDAAGLRVSSEAEKRTLIRRVYLDLTGLPPSPEAVAEFEADDNNAAAYSQMIEKLLDSPQYGERWGRHWLDVARYSDGFGGFLDNAALPDAWKYRDWVVNAFNRDLPFDDFVRHQIAGDLLKDKDAFMGPGFFAIGPTYRSDGGDPDSVAQAKAETLDDRIDALTRGFLGLTASCARCHNHKFDPIEQEDYYALGGIFSNTRIDARPLVSADVVKTYNDRQQAIRELDGRIKRRNAEIKKAKRQPTANEKVELDRWNAELKQLRATAPPKYPVATTLADADNRDLPIAIRGNPRKPGKVVPRRFLRILAKGEPAKFTKGSGRLELAAAVADPRNPLTARVFVNRVWQWHFGRALVRSPSNFGALGRKPTHPKVLDWLVADFIEHDWSIKHLHRRIMLSATYRQSAAYNERSFEQDGENELLWRMNPRRLDVEAWRDTLLTVTGELDRTVGGAPTEDVVRSKRRTLYFKVSRNGDRFATDEFLRLFDFPIPRASIAERSTSIVPQQYLFLLNSSFMVDRARVLVIRLEKQSADNTARIDYAYRLLYGRLPSETERRIGLAFLQADSKPVIAAKQPARKADDMKDVLIANFDGDGYGKWSVEGEAFGPGPARGTLDRQMTVSGFQGRGLVNTYFNGDNTTGTLTSPEFTIEKSRITFLIGGGNHPGKTCMELLVDGKVVRTATGRNNEKLDWQAWNVKDLAGKTVRLRIADRQRGGWGHVNVDQIVQTNRQQVATAPVVPNRNSNLSQWVRYAQVLLSSNEFMYVR